MPFTHYPKLEENLFLSACWYGENDPRNTIDQPLAPGAEGVVLHGVAQNFTRFYGTVAADQPLDVTFSFSNEERVLVTGWTAVGGISTLRLGDDPVLHQEPMFDSALPKEIREHYPVDERGLREVTDEDLGHLNYDGIALVSKFEPGAAGKPSVGDKFLVTIYGRFMRVQITNRGTAPVKKLRVFVRASVF